MRCWIACLLTAALTAGVALVWQNRDRNPLPDIRSGIVRLYDPGLPLKSEDRQQLVERLARQRLDAEWDRFVNSNDVTDLALDGDVVWATTVDGGLVRWDARSGAYVKLTQENGLYSDSHSAIAIGVDGALWVDAGTVLRLASDGRWQVVGRPWRIMRSSPREQPDRRRSESGSVIVAEPRNRRMWFPMGYGVARLTFEGMNTNSVTIWEEFIPQADRGTSLGEATLTNLTTDAIAVAPDGAVWVGGLGGATRFVSRFVNDQDQQGYPLRDHVTAIAFEPDGAVWFGTMNGLIRQGSDGSQQRYTAERNGLADDRILALAVTDDGTVWAGTAQGVSRAGPERQWSTYTALDGLDSLVDNYVRAIKIGDDGSVWFGTSRGISRLEPNGRWRTYVTQDVVPSNNVRDVAIGPDGAVWFCTDAGVSRLLPDGRQVSTALPGLEDYGRYYCYDIAVGPDGVVWIATSTGVGRFSSDGQWRAYGVGGVNRIAFGPDGKVWTSGREIGWLGPDEQWRSVGDAVSSSIVARSYDTTIAIGADSVAWIGTSSRLGRLRPDGQWQVLTASDGLPEGIEGGHFASAPDGTVWLAVEDRLFVLGREGRWQEQSVPYPGVWIEGFHFDQDGAIWVFSSSEALRYDGEQWREFRLPARYFGQLRGINAIATEADGTVWFGTSKGAWRYRGKGLER